MAEKNSTQTSISYKNYKNFLLNKIIEIESILMDIQQAENRDNSHKLFQEICYLYELTEIHSDKDVLAILNEFGPSLDSKTNLIPHDQLNNLHLIIAKLKSFLARDDMEHEKNFNKTAKNLTLYIFEKDIEFATYLKSQMMAFDYNIRIFNQIDQFNLQLLKEKKIALIINVNLLTPELEASLIKIKESQEYQQIKVLFIASEGDITARLQAIRLNGIAYLVKPFLTQELVMRLEHAFLEKNKAHRILIIDDDKNIAQTYFKILEEGGFQPRINTHFTQVLPTISEFNPDLILMDIYMPYCNGLELATIIRQQTVYDGIPIMFLSSEEDTYKQLNAMSVGADEFIHKSVEPKYLNYAIKNKISRYKSLRANMVIDGLTNVFNHTNIQQQLEIAIKLSDRLEKPLSIAMIDLDNFKYINDHYGHLAGDYVLRNFCLMMRRRLRATDIIGRYGGEEFLIIFPNTNFSIAKQVIEDLKQQFNEFAHTWNSQIFYVTFSGGIASFPQYRTATTLIQASDSALYIAKNQGKNRVQVVT